jgi:hypothetical protein
MTTSLITQVIGQGNASYFSSLGHFITIYLTASGTYFGMWE